MRKIIAFLPVMLCIAWGCNNVSQRGTANASNKGKITAITHVHLIPMTAEEVIPDQTVIIKDETIETIGAADKIKIPEGATVIEGEGKYLMPGLAEMHAHIPTDQNGADLVKETLFLYLSNGITTIRGMLGAPYHLKLRERVNKKEILSPRVYTSGPSFNGNTVTSPEVAAQMVRAQKEAGYDFLKLHPGITLENFNVIMETAQEVGIPFAGHVPVDVGIRRAIEAHYASIDHLDGYLEGLVPAEANVKPNENGFFGFNFTDLADTNHIAALAKATKEAGVWVVPTQSLLERWVGPGSPDSLGHQPEMKYLSNQTVSDWISRKSQFMSEGNYEKATAVRFNKIRRQIIKTFYDEGVGLLLGSDAPQVFNVPGFSIHHELEALILSGLTPYQALRTGTVNPAVYFDAEGEFGTLVTGSSADMILLNENPLENITHLRNRAGVMVRGEWLPEEKIQQRLQTIAGKYTM